jgi:hypothetical protein
VYRTALAGVIQHVAQGTVSSRLDMQLLGLGQDFVPEVLADLALCGAIVPGIVGARRSSSHSSTP